MVIPPAGPGPTGPAPAPAPTQPAPPPYPYYPPPPSKRTSTVLTVVAIVVVLAVVVTVVIAAVLLVLMSPFVGPDVTTPPAIAFGPASLSAGNATLAVAGVSREASIGLFSFRLEVNSARSPASAFSGSGIPQIVSVSGTTYQVAWTDEDLDGFLSLTDTVLVAGDGVPLGAGSYALRLIWTPTGTEVTVRTWTV